MKQPGLTWPTDQASANRHSSPGDLAICLVRAMVRGYGREIWSWKGDGPGAPSIWPAQATGPDSPVLECHRCAENPGQLLQAAGRSRRGKQVERYHGLFAKRHRPTISVCRQVVARLESLSTGNTQALGRDEVI